MSRFLKVLPTLQVLKGHGLKMPFVAASRLAQYLRCKLRANRGFVLNGRTHKYFYHLYNGTYRTERCVEIPIVLSYLRAGLATLEVGNVLSHYVDCSHEIVDKYEAAPGVVNEDIVTFSPGRRYDLIVSISTLEHVGWDEHPREEAKVLRAVQNMKQLLKKGGTMVVTVPVGYNAYLDSVLDRRLLGFDQQFFMKRISKDNKWRETRWEEVKGTQYGAPFICANAIAVCLFTGR